jgi:hypothetical protein
VPVIGIEEHTKNIGSRRLIPVHSQLSALGFDKHVADLRKRKQTHLFPVWYREGQRKRKRQRKLRRSIIIFHTIAPPLQRHLSAESWH